jgi:hypothetical protein
VDFLTNLAARRDTHQHDLAMYTGDDLLTKVLVLLRKRHDISVELHDTLLSDLVMPMIAASSRPQELYDSPFLALTNNRKATERPVIFWYDQG